MDLIVLCGVESNEDYNSFVDLLRDNKTLTFIDNKKQLDSLQGTQKNKSKLKKTTTSARKSKAVAQATPPIFMCEQISDLKQLELMDLHCRFLLFYNSPEQYIAESKTKLETSISRWQDYAQQLFAFYIGNMADAALINIQNITVKNKHFCQYLFKHADIEIKERILLNALGSKTLSNTALVLKSLNQLDNDSGVQVLYEQLESAAEFVDDINLASFSSRQQNYLTQIIKQSTVLEKNTALKEQLAVLEKEHAALKSDSEKQLAALKKENSEFKSAYEKQLAELKKENSEFKSANETQVSQLSQLQEELKLSATKFDELDKQKAELLAQISKLNAQQNEDAETIDGLQVSITEAKEENELCMMQIQQLQEELESVFEKQQATIADVEAKKKEAETLLSEKSQLLADIQRIEKEKSLVEEDGELSLLQINQLQEELEYYYLKLQQMQAFTTEVSSVMTSTMPRKNSVRLLSYLA